MWWSYTYFEHAVLDTHLSLKKVLFLFICAYIQLSFKYAVLDIQLSNLGCLSRTVS